MEVWKHELAESIKIVALYTYIYKEISFEKVFSLRNRHKFEGKRKVEEEEGKDRERDAETERCGYYSRRLECKEKED